MSMNNSLSDIVTLVEGVASLSQENNNLKFSDHTSQTARKAAIQAARRLIAILQKPEEQIQHTAFLPLQNVCARIACDLNLFNLVVENDHKNDGKPTSAKELASQCDAEHLFVARIMRVLVSNGFFSEIDTEAYAPNDITKAMTQPKFDACIKFFFDQALVTGVKTPQFFRERGYKSPVDAKDGPYQYAFNTDMETFQYWVAHPEMYETFNVLMTGSKGSKMGWTSWFPVQQEILSTYQEGEGSVLLVDIGGGHGTEIAHFNDAFPDAPGRLVLQDLPAVINDIKTLDTKIERHEHDFFTPQPIKDALVYYFHFVLHDWPDAEAIAILRNTAAAMKPNYSKLLINELILPDTKCSFFDAGLDINMMNLHSGIERSESQWRFILESAGLKVIKFWRASEGPGVVEASLP